MLAILIINYNGLLLLNCKLNILSSILSCVLIIYKAVLYHNIFIIINLQLPNTYKPLISRPLPTLYLLIIAAQLDAVYTIEEA